MKKTKLTSLNQLSEEWKAFNKYPDYLEISNYGRVRTIGRMIEYYNHLGNLVQYWAPSKEIKVYADHTEPKFRYFAGENHSTFNLFKELKEHFGNKWFFEHSWNGIHERRGTMKKSKATIIDGGSFREPDPEAKKTVTELKIMVGVDEKFKQLMQIAMTTNDYDTRRQLLELCMEISKNGQA